MVILTDSERVRLRRRGVLEFLASSVDVSTAPLFQAYMDRYGAKHERSSDDPATVALPVKIDNDRYPSFATPPSASSAISAWRRAARTRRTPLPLPWPAAASALTSPPISTCHYRNRPESIAATAVCPTGALMFKTEHDMRQAGTWNELRQTVTDTICPSAAWDVT